MRFFSSIVITILYFAVHVLLHDGVCIDIFLIPISIRLQAPATKEKFQGSLISDLRSENIFRKPFTIFDLSDRHDRIF
ncbi:hypothetical protein WI98_25305 [Burkholderia vietnamiensis]|nr:hypothetical protein WI98_25305 [Burkholderia vietnamiensis]